MYKRQSLTNIEITEQNIKAFSVVAKKYDIDYAPVSYTHLDVYKRQIIVRECMIPMSMRCSVSKL